MDEWVCRTCGATYSEETTPCLQCASDSVRHVDDEPEDYSVDAVAFRCTNCGRTVPKHTPPCDRCGNMTLETASGDDLDDSTRAPPTAGSTRRDRCARPAASCGRSPRTRSA